MSFCIDSIHSSANSFLYQDRQKFSELLSQYQEFNRFNVQSPEDASIYLLAEGHTDQQSHVMQASVINFLASQGPVIVLFEGLESAEVLSDEIKEGFLHVRNLPLLYKNNISIVGWDVSEEIIRSIGTPKHVLDQIAKNVQELENELNFLIQKINEIAPGIIKDHCFDDSIVMSLEDEKWEKISEMDHREIIYETIVECHKKFKELKEKPFRREMLEKTFPQRTEAMISTLQRLDKIKENMGVKDAKVVLVAGVKHLKTDKEDVGSSYCDLSGLYRELENHKALVLIPPHIWE